MCVKSSDQIKMIAFTHTQIYVLKSYRTVEQGKNQRANEWNVCARICGQLISFDDDDEHKCK